MKRLERVFLGLALAAALESRCASSQDSSEVRVTHNRSEVQSCIDLAQVRTDLDEVAAAEKDLKRQTADLGGNVLLIYNVHSGGAFYCAALPPPIELITPAPGSPAYATPRPLP